MIPSGGSLEDTYVVDLVCSDIAWLGHVKLIIKGDNERALVLIGILQQKVRAKVSLSDIIKVC